MRAEEASQEAALRVERQMLLQKDDQHQRGAEVASKLKQLLSLQQELEVCMCVCWGGEWLGRP